MVKRFPKSRKLISSAIDEVHVFGDGLVTLDENLELVLDLFDKGEPCITGGGGLLNQRD